MEEVRRSFVAVAASDVDYKNRPDKEKLEYRLLMQIFAGQREGLHQGIYAATSSGRFLGRINTGWPDPDPVAALRLLRQALASYRRMPAGERVLSTRLDPARDRMLTGRDYFKRPADLLDLRVVKRSYPFTGMTSFDVRHPMYFSIDRLWYREHEYRAWVPREQRAGASIQVRGPALDRLIYLHHLMQSPNPWNPDEIRRAVMTSTVTGVDGGKLKLKISAEFDLKAHNQWNQGTYRGNLLGSAAYDPTARRFTAFELLSLGTHVQSPMQSHMHAGSPTSQVGALITLNPQTDPDDRLLPAEWFYGYPRGWGS